MAEFTPPDLERHLQALAANIGQLAAIEGKRLQWDVFQIVERARQNCATQLQGDRNIPLYWYFENRGIWLGINTELKNDPRMKNALEIGQNIQETHEAIFKLLNKEEGKSQPSAGIDLSGKKDDNKPMDKPQPQPSEEPKAPRGKTKISGVKKLNRTLKGIRRFMEQGGNVDGKTARPQAQPSVEQQELMGKIKQCIDVILAYYRMSPEEQVTDTRSVTRVFSELRRCARESKYAPLWAERILHALDRIGTAENPESDLAAIEAQAASTNFVDPVPREEFAAYVEHLAERIAPEQELERPQILQMPPEFTTFLTSAQAIADQLRIANERAVQPTVQPTTPNPHPPAGGGAAAGGGGGGAEGDEHARPHVPQENHAHAQNGHGKHKPVDYILAFAEKPPSVLNAETSKSMPTGGLLLELFGEPKAGDGHGHGEKKDAHGAGGHGHKTDDADTKNAA